MFPKYIGHGNLIEQGVSIGTKALISNHCNVGSNSTIGNHSKICIGAVVTKNVKRNSMIFGNPGKKIILLNKIL